MKEQAPLVGKTKKSKSEEKFYSDEEDEKEEGSESSGSEDSSSSGTFLRFETTTYRNANVRSVGVQNQAVRARMRRKVLKIQTSLPLILGRVPVPLKRVPVSLNLNKR